MPAVPCALRNSLSLPPRSPSYDPASHLAAQTHACDAPLFPQIAREEAALRSNQRAFRPPTCNAPEPLHPSFFVSCLSRNLTNLSAKRAGFVLVRPKQRNKAAPAAHCSQKAARARRSRITHTHTRTHTPFRADRATPADSSAPAFPSLALFLPPSLSATKFAGGYAPILPPPRPLDVTLIVQSRDRPHRTGGRGAAAARERGCSGPGARRAARASLSPLAPALPSAAARRLFPNCHAPSAPLPLVFLTRARRCRFDRSPAPLSR